MNLANVCGESADMVAIVTGGGRGLGMAMTVGLLRTGARVAALSSTPADLQQLAKQAINEGLMDRLLLLDADVRLAEHCEHAVDDVVRHFGKVNVLINNAAITPAATWPGHDYQTSPKYFWEVSPEMQSAVMDVNVNGAFFMAAATTRRMLSSGYGRIVNVTTSLATMQRIGFAPYGPSKAALEAASLIWSRELEATGITVNILNPGGGADTDGVPSAARVASRLGSGPKLVEPASMVPPLLWICSVGAASFNGMRIDAKDWDCGLLAADAASAAGRPIGFELRSKNAVSHQS